MYRTRSLRLFLYLSLSLLLFITPAHAQTPIPFNEAVLGELTSAPVTYTFNGVANQSIALEILSITNGFAPSFLLVDTGNRVIAQGQSAPGSSDVRQALTLPSDGTYLLIITASTPQPGEYVVRLSTDAVVPQPQPPVTQPTTAPAMPPAQAVLDGVVCQEIMDELLTVGLNEACTSVGRNEACYVNDNITVQPDLDFEQQGDLVDIEEISGMFLEPFSQFGWGVALLRVQANLPDTLPGQNVLIFAFGGINLQANPQSGATAPLQSFYVTGGIGSTTCRGVPTDGILIQTPASSEPVELFINEIGLEIASTVFIEINQEKTLPELQINTLEGLVNANYNGVQRMIPAGQRVNIPIDNQSGRPLGDLQDVTPLDPSRMPQFILNEFGDTLTELVTLETEPEQPVLPETGACVLATFEPVVVNARSGPGTDFDVTGRLDPDLIYNVIGRNADSSWFETSQGWSAGFVTRRGGDCSNLPITYIPPTPIPTATPVPPRPSGIVIDAERFGYQTAVSGQLRPDGADRVTLQYNIINVNDNNAFRSVELVITCTSDSESYFPGNVRLYDGFSPGCDSQPRSFYVPLTPTTQTVTISRPNSESFPEEGATLNWRIVFSVVASD